LYYKEGKMVRTIPSGLKQDEMGYIIHTEAKNLRNLYYKINDPETDSAY
jgi:hypothetical protein